MKRILLLAAMLCAAATVASAQNYKEYFVLEEVGMEYPSWYSFKFDFDGKFFYHESDSEKQQNGLIKNYKENGNTRTFDVYPSKESSMTGKDFSATFVTESETTFTFTMVRPEGYKGTFKLTTVKPKGGGDDSGNPFQNAKDKVNAKLKGALDKGLDAIKNREKKEKDKEKKEE